MVGRRALYTLIAAACVALLVVSGAQPSATQARTIKIAWVGDKSGPTVASQRPVLNAMQAYFRWVNSRGGVNGARIEMIEKDDQYSVAKEVELVKEAVDVDKAVLVTGVGNSSGFASILPILNRAKVVGFSNQGTLKTVTNPFQPYFFIGNCNYADQADVAIGYMMERLRLKNLRGVKVGVAGIAVASGQEWIENVSERVRQLGGTPVAQTLPIAIVNADVAVQTFQSERVRFILMHHGITGGIAVLRSVAKYGLDVPISGSFGVTQEIAWETTPYDAAKNFVGVNCYTPPYFPKLAAKGKLAYQIGKQYGYPESEITQQNWSLGWVNAMIIHEGLRQAKGDFSPAGVKRGLERVRNLDTGGLAPTVTLSPRCHMAIQQVRPYTYAWKTKRLIPIGTYDRWAKYIRNAYAAPGTCGKPRGK